MKHLVEIMGLILLWAAFPWIRLRFALWFGSTLILFALVGCTASAAESAIEPQVGTVNRFTFDKPSGDKVYLGTINDSSLFMRDAPVMSINACGPKDHPCYLIVYGEGGVELVRINLANGHATTNPQRRNRAAQQFWYSVSRVFGVCKK